MSPEPEMVEPAFANVREAAKFLRISPIAVYKLVQEGRIFARKYGKSIRIPWKWLHENAEALAEEEEGQVEVAIDRDVPMPSSQSRNGQGYKYPYQTMQIGDSFLFPAEIQRESARTNASKAGAKLGRKFAVHKTPEGLRCWRTE